MTINLKKLSEINNKIKDKNTKLLIVTKTRPLEEILQLINLGFCNFGENRVQEAQQKFTNIPSRMDISVSLIGPLQSNKVKQALKLFDVIQSLDRIKIIDEILKYKNENSKTKNFYIQINIGKEDQKSGVMPNDFEDFYKYCIDKCLNINGIMCIPPEGKDPAPFFSEMKMIRDRIDKNLILSMGMSLDYEIALDHQSNEIRVGSLIFS